MRQDADEVIAKAVQQGDTDAFGLLVARYEDRITRYARKFLQQPDDVSDAVQSVFVRAFERIASFDTSRAFSPWIYRVAHNVFVNVLRSRREHIPTFAFDAIVPHQLRSTETEDSVDRAAERDALARCLKKIEPIYREILVLYYFEELSYQEISDIVHIPVGTVGVRLRRAKEKVRTECPHIL